MLKHHPNHHFSTQVLNNTTHWSLRSLACAWTGHLQNEHQPLWHSLTSNFRYQHELLWLKCFDNLREIRSLVVFSLFSNILVNWQVYITQSTSQQVLLTKQMGLCQVVALLMLHIHSIATKFILLHQPHVALKISLTCVFCSCPLSSKLCTVSRSQP